MRQKNDFYNFLWIYLKCFALLVILGYILPIVFDQLIFYLYKRTVIHKNSIFVADIHDNINFFQYYYNAFRSYITY